MPLPPARDHRIPLTDAAALTARQRAGAAPGTRQGGMFHAKPVQDLLAQPGCAGLRIYNGRNADGTAALILVGVDANGNDMTRGAVLEFNYPCPPFCPDGSELNP